MSLFLHPVFVISGLSLRFRDVDQCFLLAIQSSLQKDTFTIQWLAVNPSSDNFYTDAVVPSSDQYCIETVAPSGDHYCIDIVVPPSGYATGRSLFERCLSVVPVDTNCFIVFGFILRLGLRYALHPSHLPKLGCCRSAPVTWPRWCNIKAMACLKRCRFPFMSTLCMSTIHC